MPATFRLPSVEKNNEALTAVAEALVPVAGELLESAHDWALAHIAANPNDSIAAGYAAEPIVRWEASQSGEKPAVFMKSLKRYTRGNREVVPPQNSIGPSEAFSEILEPVDDLYVEFSFNTGNLVVDRASTVGVYAHSSSTNIDVNIRSEGAQDRSEAVGALIESALSRFILPELVAPVQRFRVFIGHGGADLQWRVLRDQLRDHHGFEVTAFEGLPRAGHTIRGILEGMADDSAVAVLVMSKADEMADGGVRARQNVVHEIGYFQGRLGWSNAIVVAEDGVEIFSNLDGTQQVRYRAGDISSAVGELVGALRSRKLVGRYM